MNMRYAASGVLVAALATAALLQGCDRREHQHGHAHFGGKYLGPLLDEIEATEQQRRAIGEIAARLDREMAAFHEGHGTLHAALQEEWENGEVDEARLQALVDAQVEELRLLGQRLVAEMGAVHRLLDPEQRRKVAGMMEEHSRHGRGARR